MAVTPFDLWEEFGITEHLGGVRSTKSLLDMCQISPGDQVLDLGCGTGYTACLLTRLYGVRVIGLDINERSVSEAKDRVKRESLEDNITIGQADAHHLPFSHHTFDKILVESVMIFCLPYRITQEIFRILKPGGMLCANEITLLETSTAELNELLKTTIGIQAFDEQKWQQIFEEAGFENISSNVYKIKLWDQLTSHLEIDGLKKYLSSVYHGISDTKLRAFFLNRQMLTMARQFLPYVGYGIFVCQKR